MHRLSKRHSLRIVSSARIYVRFCGWSNRAIVCPARASSVFHLVVSGNDAAIAARPFGVTETARVPSTG